MDRNLRHLSDFSPLSAAACTDGRTLSEPRLSPDGDAIAFITRSSAGAALVVSRLSDAEEDAVSLGTDPATRGGVCEWSPDGGHLAYITRDGDVATVSATGGRPVSVIASGIVGGASALAASPDGSLLAFVGDTRAVSVVASESGRVEVISNRADFALDPSWSPDGTRLAWHEWDVPAMPWDASRIVIASATANTACTVVAGGPGVSVQQPRFAPDGSALAYLSDAGGWTNLWLAQHDGGHARPLVLEPHEHGGPVWGGGQRSFAWAPDSRSIAFSRNENGFGRLCVVDVATGSVRELSRGIHTSVTWAGSTVACLRSGARTPTSVVAIDPVTGTKRILATGSGRELVAAAKEMPEPELVEWQADDGATVHGRLWTPTPSNPSGRPPPLLVWAHGGPTDQRQVTFDPRLMFFLSRGWAVLHPDPRGSTGWGRSWTQGLREHWGDFDVSDIAAGARLAGERGWGDRSRMVAMGGSAGGMAALLLAARDPELWAAVVALYPVVDLLGLAAGTHRYEAHYTFGLVGPLPASAGRHRALSPLAHAARINCPVLLLHGSADPVVAPAQSTKLAALLRSRRVKVEHHVYEGEGHGWRYPATTEDELERTERFLQRHVRAP